MFAWGYLGKLSVQERAKRDIEQHERFVRCRKELGIVATSSQVAS